MQEILVVEAQPAEDMKTLLGGLMVSGRDEARGAASQPVNFDYFTGSAKGLIFIR